MWNEQVLHRDAASAYGTSIQNVQEKFHKIYKNDTVNDTD